MNKMIQTILIVAGIALLIYGGYELFTPEASVDIGIAKFESHNNNNAYISMGFGIAALAIGLIAKKK